MHGTSPKIKFRLVHWPSLGLRFYGATARSRAAVHYSNDHAQSVSIQSQTHLEGCFPSKGHRYGCLVKAQSPVTGLMPGAQIVCMGQLFCFCRLIVLCADAALQLQYIIAQAWQCQKRRIHFFLEQRMLELAIHHRGRWLHPVVLHRSD